MKTEKNHHDIFRKTHRLPKVSANKKPNIEQTQTKCLLSGSLALAFRMSQIVGIAPLRFVKQRDGYRVRVSRGMVAWSYFAATLWITCSCVALQHDLEVRPANSIRVSSPTRRFMWICDFVTVMLISMLGVYRAPARLNALMSCLGRIQQIKINLNMPLFNKTEELPRCVTLILVTSFSTAVIVADYFFGMKRAKNYDDTNENPHLKGDQVTTVYLYTGYYYGYITLFALETQFVCCALQLYRTIKHLNNLLEDMSKAVSQNMPFIKLNDVPPKALNQTIDSLSLNHNLYQGLTKNSSKTAHESIRYLAQMYAMCCDVMRQLNDTFAPELLVLLMSFLLHLVVTPYNFLANISGGSINGELLSLQIVWCSLHLFCTVAVVEPCHYTQNEMNRTQLLVSQLMLQNRDLLLKEELDSFASYLILNTVVYSPMGICVLTRSLVSSILASVTTYLVIMIQFQAAESKT